MTFREMNLRVFRAQPIPHVLFQPRFEPWVSWNRQFGSLPESLRELSLREIYDLVGASMRYVDYYTGQPSPYYRFFPSVKSVVQIEGNRERRRYETPFGPLFETMETTIDGVPRKVEFPGKTVDDLPALRWLMERMVPTFYPDNFRAGSDFIGERGVPQFWVPKSPYFALAQEWMKYEDFIYALVDAPGPMEEIMRVIDESYQPLYEQLIASKLPQIVNFGENVASAYLSHEYWEKYCIPWYEKRSGQLRAAGIFTHVHVDGFFKPLLKYLKHLPFDGLEALTPTPQGDVTLEELREHLGDKVLLDGIPAVLFLDHHSREELQACVEKLIEYFHPRLILGVSDELPEAATEEGFERLKWVADHCRRCTGAPLAAHR